MNNKARKELQYALYMDDCKPAAILRLTDDELCKVCISNYGADWVMSVIEGS
jgi:predicted neuraminidase